MIEGYFILELKVIPKSKETTLVGFEGDVLKVRVAEAPEKGKANDAVMALLAKRLSIPKREVTLISGQSSRHKRVLLPHSVRDIVFSWKEEL